MPAEPVAPEPIPAGRRTKPVLLSLAALAITALGGRDLILGKPVETLEVVRSDLVQTVVASGRVVTPQRVSIGVEVTGRVGLTPWRNNQATDISGGQQQRVAIARALAMRPALMLADEPTGNLDTKSSGAAFELLRRVNQESGTTFLIVTHDPRLAQRCDRIIELVDGRLTADRPNAPKLQSA